MIFISFAPEFDNLFITIRPYGYEKNNLIAVTNRI